MSDDDQLSDLVCAVEDALGCQSFGTIAETKARILAAITQNRLDAAAREAALVNGLRLFTCASMRETRPSRGESFIGWQKGDGSASKAMETAHELLENATPAAKTLLANQMPDREAMARIINEVANKQFNAFMIDKGASFVIADAIASQSGRVPVPVFDLIDNKLVAETPEPKP